MDKQFHNIFSPSEGFNKAQWVRIIDVTFLGPGMIYIGTNKKLPRWARAFLIINGALTILYNANNFFINRKLLEQKGL